MNDVFLERWVDRFDSVYGDTKLVDVPWFTAAPGLKLIESVVDGTVPRGSHVVDLGCGPGSDSVFLATAGAEVIGIDLDSDALGKARALADWAGVKVDFRQASIVDTGLPDACADIVNDSFVFHNVKDEARVAYAAEIQRILRPGGLFFLNSFSDHMVVGSGPRRITSRDIFTAFPPDRFECIRLEIYRNLPTAARADQLHWFGFFRLAGVPVS